MAAAEPPATSAEAGCTTVQLVHDFGHPWRHIFLASWQKYPNPRAPNVLSSDLLHKEVRDGRLHTTRLVLYESPFPSWLRGLITQQPIAFLEHATLDPGARTLRLSTTNITFSSIFQTTETCHYSPAPEDPEGATRLVQEARFCCSESYVGGLASGFVSRRYHQNAERGRMILEDTIRRLYPVPEAPDSGAERPLSPSPQLTTAGR